MLYDLVIFGAGPNGISLARYAGEEGLSVKVLEKKDFCYNIKKLPPELILASKGSSELGLHDLSFNKRISAGEIVDYYRNYINMHKIDIEEGVITYDIKRFENIFNINTNLGIFLSKKIIIASGIYSNPKKYPEDRDNIGLRYIDNDKCYGQNILVVGSGNSAAITIIDKHIENNIIWILRDKLDVGNIFHVWREDLLNSIKSGNVTIIENETLSNIESGRCSLANSEKTLLFDRLYILTGYSPDINFLSKFGITLKDGFPFHDYYNCNTNINGVYVFGTIAGFAQVKGAFKRVFLADNKDLSIQIIEHIKRTLE